SKLSDAVAASRCCARYASAIAPRRRVRSRSTVCSVSMRELLLVVDRPAHVGMRRARRGCGILRVERYPIEAVFEHRLHVAIGAGADEDGSRTGGLDALSPVLLGEAQ